MIVQQASEREARDYIERMPEVSRETMARLDLYVALLQRWQMHKNLVSPETLAQVWQRHILDSLQLLAIEPDAKRWCDMGSGAGFPGLVIAIMLADVAGAQFHLIESRAGKVAFLREVARQTGAPVTIHLARIEDCIDSLAGQIDVVTARALAPLDKLIGYTSSLLKTGACGLFLKGQDAALELTQAQKCWSFEHKEWPSITDPQARIIAIRLAVQQANGMRK